MVVEERGGVQVDRPVPARRPPQFMLLTSGGNAAPAFWSPGTFTRLTHRANSGEMRHPYGRRMSSRALHHDPDHGGRRAAFPGADDVLRAQAGAGPTATMAAHEYVQACIMLALGEGPAYGYGLKVELDELGLSGLDRGRIYRALRTMEVDGLVVSHWETADRGPARRTYELTADGHGRLAAQVVGVRRQRRQLSRFLARYERVRAVPADAVA
jgi:PadR family transcriptional regulator, regulatory protein PadR